MARAKAKKAGSTKKKTSTAAVKSKKTAKTKPVAQKKKVTAAKKPSPAQARPAGKHAGKSSTKSAKTEKKVVAKKAAAKSAPAKKAPAKKAPAKPVKKVSASKKAAQVEAKAPKAPQVVRAEKTPKAKVAKAPATAEAPSGKKPGIAEVKAAAARTIKKVSKRGRKRQRVTPTSTPLANWIPKDGLRPSSFLPAPPRAQSAFTVAAAPASSDRLVRDEDLKPPAPIRTIPVLVHVVQEDGRIEVRTTPLVVEAAPGDAVEWDFRYSGGADVLVTQISLEIEKPSPFGKTSYKSAKPGSARPHRQVSDIVKEKGLGSTTTYTIHCTNAFKTELAQGSASIVVREVEPNGAAH